MEAMNTEQQLKSFRQLTRWQTAIYFCAAMIGGLSINYMGFKESLGTLSILLMVAAANQYLPMLINELYEINDQLAGRSPEFQEILKRGQHDQD